MSNKYRSVKKKLILRQLQSDVDKAVPDNYSGEIRTDSWKNYQQDADKYFEVLDKQLDVLRNFKKKRKHQKNPSEIATS